jgi:hypothetical protein
VFSAAPTLLYVEAAGYDVTSPPRNVAVLLLMAFAMRGMTYLVLRFSSRK